MRGREIQVPADHRMIEARAQREQARLGPAAPAARLDGARVCRAQLEAASRGVGADRVQELTADDLDPGDPWLGGHQVLLRASVIPSTGAS